MCTCYCTTVNRFCLFLPHECYQHSDTGTVFFISSQKRESKQMLLKIKRNNGSKYNCKEDSVVTYQTALTPRLILDDAVRP